MTGSAVFKASVTALVALLLLALPATAKLMVPRDYLGVTVVLPGGWEHPGMTVRWSDDADGLWVYRPDGARRLYRPEELSALRDADGRDITRTVLPASVLGRLAPSPGGAPPPRDPAGDALSEDLGGVAGAGRATEPEPRGAGDWRFLLGVEAGWGKPHDTDFLDSDGGIGLGARLRLQLAGALYLAGGYDVQSLPLGLRPILAEPDEIPYVEHENDESHLRGVWAGLALLSPVDSEESARFYLEGGVGRYELQHMPVESSADAYLGYHAGVGFLIPLGTAAALDLGARGTHVVNLDLGYGNDEHTLIAFRVGLSILAR